MDSIGTLNINEQNVREALEKAAEGLEGEQNHPVLDFSAVRKIDAPGLRALQKFVQKAEEKKIKVVLRGVDVNVYKTLKLARLTRNFAFVN